MARKKTSTDKRPKRVFIQLPPEVGNTLDKVSQLMGVPITKLIFDCMLQDRPRFEKMLEVAHEFRRVATDDEKPDDQTKKT